MSINADRVRNLESGVLRRSDLKHHLLIGGFIFSFTTLTFLPVAFILLSFCVYLVSSDIMKLINYSVIQQGKDSRTK